MNQHGVMQQIAGDLLIQDAYKREQKFPSYNYRTYALRRVKDSFRENLHVDNPKTLDMLLNQARENLAVIKRQVSIGQMYTAQRTIVEETGVHRDL